MDGEIVQQRTSYRQGLVLGLTMAEIMLLLVFCLLIAMATRLAAAKQELAQAQRQNDRDRDTIASLNKDPAFAEKLRSLSGLTDTKEIDRYWRELVDSRTALNELEKGGLSIAEIHDRLSDINKLRAKGIDVEEALRDANIIDAINRTMNKTDAVKPSISSILNAIERGSAGQGPAGHQWPPIITLSEAGGYSFKSGSAELSPKLRDELANKTPSEILQYIKKYDVDVIEVVGHTDEQPITVRQSNLDRDLLSVLKNTASVASLIPADNAGLGLARAVSVVSVLRQSPLLAGYKLIPLSGAQLVNTDETLAISGVPGDDPERRRIEIRLRKSVPRPATANVAPRPVVTHPKPRSGIKPRVVAKPPPLSLAPLPKQITTSPSR